MENAVANRTKCEIWTRVMGYHRPVSQYNVGKKSEFYSRVYFQATRDENDRLIGKYGGGEGVASGAASKVKLLLFTTNTCPKCPAVKNWIGQSGLEFFSIDNSMLNFWEMAEKYGVQSVPTVVAVNEGGQEIWRANELSEIKEKTC